MACPTFCGFLFISLITGCWSWNGLSIRRKWESHFHQSFPLPYSPQENNSVLNFHSVILLGNVQNQMGNIPFLREAQFNKHSCRRGIKGPMSIHFCSPLKKNLSGLKQPFFILLTILQVSYVDWTQLVVLLVLAGLSHAFMLNWRTGWSGMALLGTSPPSFLWSSML